MTTQDSLLRHRRDQLLRFWRGQSVFSTDELEAFESVPREQFVTAEMRSVAYEDQPLPLLRGKTISQPSTVMLMTHVLELEPGEKVFEIGTGSGYQAALIAKLVEPGGKVVTAEVVPELVHLARANLKKCGITNVEVIEEDGSRGYEKEAPYDKIIITAASREFPPELVKQLKVDGVIVGPVGSAQEQEMVRGIKREDGTLAYEFLGQFLFSPLYGKYGFEV